MVEVASLIQFDMGAVRNDEGQFHSRSPSVGYVMFCDDCGGIERRRCWKSEVEAVQ